MQHLLQGSVWRRLGAMALALACVFPPVLAQGTESAAAPSDVQDFSEAERLLFMGDQLSKLQPPATLHYRFHKGGSLESGFDDDVKLLLAAAADGKCCAVKGEFLTGERRIDLPEIERADGNPVLLYFLERDVRDMKRLARGNENYYRKRIRMAAYKGARVTPIQLSYDGRPVDGKQVTLAPYDDDPARSRFEKYARKTYDFFLSDGVPGGIYGIRMVMNGDTAASDPMIVEELFLDGADPSTGRKGR